MTLEQLRKFAHITCSDIECVSLKPNVFYYVEKNGMVMKFKLVSGDVECVKLKNRSNGEETTHSKNLEHATKLVYTRLKEYYEKEIKSANERLEAHEKECDAAEWNRTKETYMECWTCVRIQDTIYECESELNDLPK